MSKKLTIQKRDEGNTTWLTLEGIIDENANFKDAFSGLQEKVVFDLGGIDLINSCGVREWMHALQQLPKDSQVQYVNCAPRIVEQINYVANFLGSGTVQSFYAPYFCAKCKKESNILLTGKELGSARPVKAPAEKCPTCKVAMEFDDIEEEYFSFLDEAK